MAANRRGVTAAPQGAARGTDAAGAVVLGGGMAGLLAARVLADHYARVQVLDRDDLNDGTARRRGVPQARHVHALLPRGREVLEQLFPGLTEELTAAGVPAGDLLGEARLHLNGHRLYRVDSGLLTLALSRPKLESHVRERVRVLPNVTFGPPCDGVGLVSTSGGGRVTGVRVLRRADGSAEEVVPCDLLVDATGRGSRLPTWLEALGRTAPAEERIGVDLGYATRHYRLPGDALDGDWGTLQGPTPDNPRGGALQRIEDGRWIVTVFGLAGDHPPTDPDGFLAFARSLPFSDLSDALASGEPLDEPVGFRFPASVRRHYERLRDLPDGLVPVGDGWCSLNPIYGQGMTMAALEAVALRDHIHRHGEVVGDRLRQQMAGVIDGAWEVAAGGDLALPGVEGRRTAKNRIGAAYIARLHAAAAHDPRTAAAFARAMAMIDPPMALFRPGVALRTLRFSSARHRASHVWRPGHESSRRVRPSADAPRSVSPRPPRPRG